jgi:2',3'-cyclic-nucleotide 2'-phosphodiesterase (5'-nucleotidase family)
MKNRNIASKFGIIVSCVFLLLFSMSFAGAEESVIRILYVNDFHGFAEPYRPLGSQEPHGGIAYLAARAEELRNERPSLLLSAGDMLQGNNWANLFQGKSAIELMNTMRFDAMVAGNHEFDFGQEILRKRISEARFPVLGANVRGLDLLKPYVIREVGGVKVAIIGVVTEDAPVSTHPRNVAGLEFDPPAAVVQRYARELEGKADIFLVLSHIGLSEDRALAERAKGIDIIVGGHSHTKLLKPLVVGNTIIVQAWEHAKTLGVLDLTVRDGKIIRFEGHLEEIRPKQGTEHKAVLAVVEMYQKRLDTALNEKVGATEVDLDGENARKRETNLGDLIADIVRQVSGADAAIINGGEIRTDIRNGEIRVKDVYSVLPFNDYVVAIRLTGGQIREALEHGVSAIEEGGGRFPQVSGLSFAYDPTAGKGSRVKEILIAGIPVDPDKFYSVATNDFLAAGGDGYKVFGEAIGKSKELSMTEGIIKGGKVLYSDPGSLLKDIVIEYIREKKNIAPKIEGRIREIP